MLNYRSVIGGKIFIGWIGGDLARWPRSQAAVPPSKVLVYLQTTLRRYDRRPQRVQRLDFPVNFKPVPHPVVIRGLIDATDDQALQRTRNRGSSSVKKGFKDLIGRL